MLRILMNALRTGVVTTRYPAETNVPPDRFRGPPQFRAGVSLPPAALCPAGALEERSDGDRRHLVVDLARCIFCGRCAEEPWTGAVIMGRDFELAARHREDLRIDAITGACERSATDISRDVNRASDRVASEIHQVLGRSLHLRHLDAGSCNACDWELAALLNPVYDVRRLGIDFVASPRHADGVIVTGPVTRNLELAVRRTVDAVPEPRMVIAVGACAASGGIAGRGYASAGGVDRVLPVDVHIPGCPPRPEAIIFGILVALGRLHARRSRSSATQKPGDVREQTV